MVPNVIRTKSKSFALPEKGLLIKEPWIDLILSGQKIWEMRSVNVNIRGTIALIKQGSGLIYGQADIVDCLDNLTFPKLIASYDKHGISDEDLLRKWRVAWVLDDVLVYDEPVHYTHPKGAQKWVKLVD